MTTDVAEAADAAIQKASTSSKQASEKAPKKPRTPGKLETKMRKGVREMTAPLTNPVKNTIERVRSRAMGLVEKMKTGGKLTWKEILIIAVASPIPGHLIGHYAHMLSKKMMSAIEK